MTVAVVTSLYGGYDELAVPPPQTVDVLWIAVVDDISRVQTDGPAPWLVVEEPRPGISDRLAAKVAKCRPDLYVHVPVDATIWLDASARLNRADSVERLVQIAGDSPLAQWPHPDRDCALAEGEFSVPLHKYAHQPIAAQVEHYRAAGHPERWGLWATGVIVRPTLDPLRNELVRNFGNAWLVEQMRWSDQDQVSEAPVLDRLGLRPAPLPGWLWGNDLVTWAGHLRP